MYGLTSNSVLTVSRSLEIDAGIEYMGSGGCTDILLPKIYPDKKELLKSVLRKELVGKIEL